MPWHVSLRGRVNARLCFPSSARQLLNNVNQESANFCNLVQRRIVQVHDQPAQSRQQRDEQHEHRAVQFRLGGGMSGAFFQGGDALARLSWPFPAARALSLAFTASMRVPRFSLSRIIDRISTSFLR